MTISPKVVFLGLMILAFIALVATGTIQIAGVGTTNIQEDAANDATSGSGSGSGSGSAADTKEEPPKRLFDEPHANAVEFGGMYGYASGTVKNPNTTRQSCPSGFLSYKILGTSDVDHSATFCYKPINNPSTWTPSVGSSEFGGMFGYVDRVKVNNPVTGEHSCPYDFNKTRVLGTSDVDYSLYYCDKPIDAIEDVELMKKWKPSLGAVQFGGIYGHVDGEKKNNPISNEFSCPAGFYQTQVLGTSDVDYSLYYCSREW
jgi:hypothetical protein